MSFEKGCYVGQETVARLHWRGKPNRHLRGLELSEPVPAGSVLLAGEREVGRVTSPVVHPERGPIALALVRREVAPGDPVAVRPAEDGAEAAAGGAGVTGRVVALSPCSIRYMAYTSRVLVVARQTAASDDLRDALLRRAERGPIAITLLMPAPRIGFDGQEAAKPELEAALARLRDAGLDATGVVGDCNPLEAVAEVWSPGAFDEVVVSTLPGATSKWMVMDFPHRVGRMTDVPVAHVIARPPGYATPRVGPAPRHEREPLGPLAALAWPQPRGS